MPGRIGFPPCTGRCGKCAGRRWRLPAGIWCPDWRRRNRPWWMWRSIFPTWPRARFTGRPGSTAWMTRRCGMWSSWIPHWSRRSFLTIWAPALRSGRTRKRAAPGRRRAGRWPDCCGKPVMSWRICTPTVGLRRRMWTPWKRPACTEEPTAPGPWKTSGRNWKRLDRRERKRRASWWKIPGRFLRKRASRAKPSRRKPTKRCPMRIRRAGSLCLPPEAWWKLIPKARAEAWKEDGMRRTAWRVPWSGWFLVPPWCFPNGLFPGLPPRTAWLKHCGARTAAWRWWWGETCCARRIRRGAWRSACGMRTPPATKPGPAAAPWNR